MAVMTSTPTNQDYGAADKAKEAASATADKAKEAASATADKAKEAASATAGKAKDVAGVVADAAGQTVTAVGKAADSVVSDAGTGIKRLGETIAEKAPHDGALGTASQAVAKTIKDGGAYLEEAKLSGVADDLGDMIRRNPVPAVLVGIGLGFLLGKVLGGRS